MLLIDVMQVKKRTLFSFVGAGGKTSLIFIMAKELADKGYCVLVTTTTAMFLPERDKLNFNKILFGDIISDKRLSFNYPGVIVAASKYDKKRNKLIGYLPEYVGLLSAVSCFDCILVEADGAKRRPIKAPSIHEPVIPEGTSAVVGCIGLDCFGKRIDDVNVHRPEYFLSLLSERKSNLYILGKEHLLSLVLSDKGLFKNTYEGTDRILFLNKADNLFLINKGREIACAIEENCVQIKQIIVASLKDTQNPIKSVYEFNRY